MTTAIFLQGITFESWTLVDEGPPMVLLSDVCVISYLEIA